MEESTERRERRGSQGGFGAIDFPTFGAVPVSPRALYKLLKRGDPTLLYPGGVREAFKSTKRGESYKLFWCAIFRGLTWLSGQPFVPNSSQSSSCPALAPNFSFLPD